MIRQKFNDFVKRNGNDVYGGLGDLLTRRISLIKPLAIAGAIVPPLLYGQFLVKSMQIDGVFDKIDSPRYVDRISGTAQALPYQFSWFIGLPTSVVLGAAVMRKVGEGLDSL